MSTVNAISGAECSCTVEILSLQAARFAVRWMLQAKAVASLLEALIVPPNRKCKDFLVGEDAPRLFVHCTRRVAPASA
jgi:hypothetical protein